MANAVRRIVVTVEDDRRVRESIQGLMESAGYTPIMFSSGEELLQSGSLAAATCVITDVFMPGMDGIEVQRRIRLERPELPVIFISGRYSTETRKRALDEGAVEFLYKPFEPLGLLEVIQTALAHLLLAQASKE